MADVEGSTRLWESQPEEMTAAVARLNRAVSDIIAAQRIAAKLAGEFLGGVCYVDLVVSPAIS